MNKVITVENMSKKYILRHQSGERYVALRDVIMDKVSFYGKRVLSPFAAKQCSDPSHEDFWALKDINFQINEGEKIGIIGRNGAGKSTILKILSRITEPTTGTISIWGRVASLLEVGTGFHPELTGRENIYLNGAILGMRKEEIKRKYDEIVAFAEVEKFLDTPVKRYSSGMYVRLAFAVAAHLEPEILIVDEVLAVGDAEFQKKCLGKMGKVAQEGRTVIFVSHNMEAVRMLCSRCILLNKGNIVADSNVDSVMSSYRTLLRGINIDAETGIYNEANRRGYGFIRFTSVEILDTNGNKQFSFTTGESVRFKMSYRVLQEVQGLSVFIGVRSSMTREYVTSVHYSISAANLKPGTTGMIEIELPEINLLPGEYPLYIWIGGKGKFEHDVLDDLTAPLTIICQDGHEHEPSSGFFMLPSRLVANVINKNNPNN